MPVLRRIGDLIPKAVADIVVASILVGFPKRSVTKLSRMCQLSTRTLERRLAEAGVATAKQLLARSLCMHALWYLEVHEWSFKRTSTAAGFSSPSLLGEYLKRHCHLSYRQLLTTGSFARSVDQFAETLSGREPTRMPKKQ